MSDSYTKWCDDREEKAAKFSEPAFASAKSTSQFKRRLAAAEKLLSETNVVQARSCANCRHREAACFPRGQYYVASCMLLGLKDVSSDWCCDKWKPTQFSRARVIRGLRTDPDVIGYGIVKDKKL